MERWAYTGIGIQGVQKAYASGQEIVIYKFRRAQILPRGVQNIAGCRQNLRNDDIDLQPFEAIEKEKKKVEITVHKFLIL